MRIEWLKSAIIDLHRLRDFILPHNRAAAQRAFRTIRAASEPLMTNPRIGKPVEGLPDCRELIIPFGSSGYVLRYRITGDTVYIHAVKHGKEAGFTDQASTLWMVKDPLDEAWGFLADGEPSVTEALLEERRKDNEREERKFGIGGAGVEE